MDDETGRNGWIRSPTFRITHLQLLDSRVTPYGDVAVDHARIRQDAALAG